MTKTRRLKQRQSQRQRQRHRHTKKGVKGPIRKTCAKRPTKSRRRFYKRSKRSMKGG
jgi:hypothetical protein